MAAFRSTVPYALPEPNARKPQLAQGVEWSFPQEQFQRWLSIPKKLRPDGLKTMVDVATKLNVSTQTLRKWKRLPGFWSAVYEQTRSLIGEDLPDVMVALTREAKGGSVNAIKLYFDAMGIDLVRSDEVPQTTDQLVIIMPALPQSPFNVSRPGQPNQHQHAGEIVDGEAVRSEPARSGVFTLDG